LKAQVDQLVPLIQQLAGEVQKNSQGLAEQEQVNAEQQEHINLAGQLAGEVKKIGEKVQQLVSGPMVKIVESLKYSDAPPDVQRQIEVLGGLEPSHMQPTDPNIVNGHLAIGQAQQEAVHAEDSHLTEEAIKKARARQALAHDEDDHAMKARHAEELKNAKILKMERESKSKEEATATE
jgi:hypothetical protein